MTSARLSVLVARKLLDHAAPSAPAPARSLDVVVLCKSLAAARSLHEQIGEECAAIASNLVRRNTEISWWSLGEAGLFLRLNVTCPSLLALRGINCDVLFIQDDEDNASREIRGSQYPIESLDQIIRVWEESHRTVLISREATHYGVLLLDSSSDNERDEPLRTNIMEVEELD